MPSIFGLAEATEMGSKGGQAAGQGAGKHNFQLQQIRMETEGGFISQNGRGRMATPVLLAMPPFPMLGIHGVQEEGPLGKFTSGEPLKASGSENDSTLLG